MRRMLKKGLGLSSLGILALLTTQVYAAGFKIEFQSASTIADAGDAAIVDDASTNWYNAAGLTMLPQQLVSVGTLIYAPATFSGDAFAPNRLPLGLPPFVGSGRASSHTTVVIPAFHYSYPIDSSWAVGFSAVPAWGLIESYGERSLVRYTGNKIYTKSMDLLPSVAWKFNDNWSFGLGPDFHYFSTAQEFMVNTMFGPLGLTDSRAHFYGQDWAYGFHAGVLFQFNPCIRVGLNYRSKLVQHAEGHSSLDTVEGHLPPGSGFSTNDFEFRITHPPVTTLSGFVAVTPELGITSTVEFEQWAIQRAYYATNIAGQGREKINATIPTLYSNTWDFAVGARYLLGDSIILRGSIKRLGTPTDNRVRLPLIPDAQKLGLQLGAHLQYNKYLGLDVAYGHAWFRTVPIHATNPITLATNDGRTRGSVDFLAGQIVWTIC